MLSVRKDTKEDERAAFAIQRSYLTLVPPKECEVEIDEF